MTWERKSWLMRCEGKLMKLLKPTKRVRLCAMLLLMTPLASCATMTVSGGIKAPPELRHAAFCQVAKPISWSSKDTPETVVEVKSHNSVYLTLCGHQ